MSLLFIKHPREADLALFAGGELGPLARWRIERHLDRCGACQEVVADFFHLQGDLSEIAELPEVDWQAVAHQIKVAAAQAAPEAGQAPAPGWFARPAAWKLGLASATVLCAFVVVQQLPLVETQPESIALQSKAEEAAAINEAGADKGGQQRVGLAFSDKSATLEQNKSAADAPARQELDEIAAGVAKEAAQAAQKRGRLARGAPSPSEEEAVAAFGNQAQADREALQGRRYALASEDEKRARSAVADAKVPLAQPAESSEKGRAAEGAETQTAGEQRRVAVASADYRADTPADLRKAQADPDDAAGAGGRLEQAASAGVQTETKPVLEAQLREGGRAKGEITRRLSTAAATKDSLSSREEAEPPGPSYLPASFENAGAEIGVAADGWVSIRTLDSDTSTITITNVYVP